MTTRKFYFSKSVLEHLEKPRTTWEELIYRWFYKQAEEQINPLLDPTNDDMDIILSSASEIDSYCLEQTAFADGIFYMAYKVVIKASYLNSVTSEEVAQKILTKMRKHWHTTRNYDCAPFIALLTPRQLIIAQPLSIRGMKTLAKMQHEQQTFQKQQMDERANRQIRITREKRASSQSTEQ